MSPCFPSLRLKQIGEKKKTKLGQNDDIQKPPGAKLFYEQCYSIVFLPVTTSHMNPSKATVLNPSKATVQPTRDLQLTTATLPAHQLATVNI